MFNRKIQVDVVKDKKSTPVKSETNGLTFENKAAIVATYSERVIKKVGYTVCAYVILDTFRKVMVASATPY